MKRENIYNIRKAVVMTMIAVLSVGFASCSSDDDKVERTPVDSPNASLTNSTVSALTFNWNKVSDATQYAYELRDPSGTLVKGGVTSDTTVSFTSLKPSTTYTLDVWAYAAAGSQTHKGSKVASLTATTPDVVSLSVPQPTVEVEKSTATVTWGEVTDAASYTVSYGLAGEEMKTVQTKETTVTLKKLAIGEYKLVVAAVAGGEAYSGAVSDTLTFNRDKYELWRCEGKYQSGSLSKSWKTNIVAYDDLSYVILDWYGVQGVDFEFTVDNNNEIVIPSEYRSDGYVGVKTGLSSFPDAWIYTSSGYSTFEGNNKSGTVSFWNSSAYDSFTWSSETVRELWTAAGTYHSELLGSTWSANLVAYSDGTYTLKNWYGVDGYDLSFTVTDGLVVAANSFSSGYGYDFVYTGVNGSSWLAIYPSAGYSVFSGSAEEGGYISFYYAYSESYAYVNEWFEWNPTSQSQPQVTLADLAGTYTEHSVGVEYLWYNSSFDWTNEKAVTISVADEATNQVKITNFFYSGTDLTGTVDLTNKTITIDLGVLYTYYTFASSESESKNVVCTFDDDFTITLPGWALWYNYEGTWSQYAIGKSSVLTKVE
jgi:hypothetical protein